MASVIDAFSEAFSEDKALLKIILYSIPVYFALSFFTVGKTSLFIFWGTIVAFLCVGLLTQGINNVRLNKSEILTLNPLNLVIAIIKSAIVLVPHLIIYCIIGSLVVSNVKIPSEWTYVPLTFKITVWVIVFSIILTSYLSFAKKLDVIQGFNYSVIGESCVDVFFSLLFFVPQLLIADIVLVGPVAYLYYYLFRLPFSHWGFVFACSVTIVINISILANYFAQVSFENLKGSNDDYNDNYQITLSQDPKHFLDK